MADNSVEMNLRKSSFAVLLSLAVVTGCTCLRCGTNKNQGADPVSALEELSVRTFEVCEGIPELQAVLAGVVSDSTYVGLDQIEKQLSVGRAFIDAVNGYIDGKEYDGEVRNLMDIVAEWSPYCGKNAILSPRDVIIEENDDSTPKKSIDHSYRGE